jgi:hypothetical protein
VGGHFLIGGFGLVVLRDHHDGIDFALDEGLNIPFHMGVIDEGTAGPFLKHFSEKDWTKIDFSRFSKSLNPEVTRYSFTLDKILEQELSSGP